MPSPVDIRLTCPGCGKKLGVAEKDRGRSIRCDGCQKPLRVPEDTKPKSSLPKKPKKSNRAFLIRMGVLGGVLAILLVVGLLRIVGVLAPISVTVGEPANPDPIASSTDDRSRSVSGPSLPFKAGGVGRKTALVVGVKNYQHPKLRPLRYSENDAVELAKVLGAGGYDVTLLCDREGEKDADKRPTRPNIYRQLEQTLAKCQDRNDTVVVGLAGHGLQFEAIQDSFFCPADAKPFAEEKDSLVSINHIYEQLVRCYAGSKARQSHHSG